VPGVRERYLRALGFQTHKKLDEAVMTQLTTALTFDDGQIIGLCLLQCWTSCQPLISVEQLWHTNLSALATNELQRTTFG
jgi:hypothetical protein